MSLQKEYPEVMRAQSFPKYLIPVLLLYKGTFRGHFTSEWLHFIAQGCNTLKGTIKQNRMKF